MTCLVHGAAAGASDSVASSFTFADLGLDAALLRAVADLGFVEPTPVQCAAIPAALPQPHGAWGDLIGCQPDRQRQDRGLPAAAAARHAERP